MIATVGQDVAAKSPRIAAIDALRGVAIVGMVVYHFCWDLTFFNLAAFDIDNGFGWIIFRTLVAGGFLTLVGVSLVLAHREGIRWRGFWRRFIILAIAALVITIASYQFVPQAFIFFGILHAIAVFSLIGLAFLRLPWWLCGLAAAGAIAMQYAASPAFNWPPIVWLGLSDPPPVSNDFEPLFPWFGAVLLGMAIAKTGIVDWLAGWRGTDPLSRALGWAGRYSLAIYLVHQVVLIGALYLFTQVFGAGDAASAYRQGFGPSCQINCQTEDFSVDFCTAYCTCLADEIDAEDLWQAIAPDTLSASDQLIFNRMVQSCAAAASDDAN
ncbi:MAG: heparan-alpha-glucosaminide N-acetyltransferase [Pseudomonadota bacterium]